MSINERVFITLKEKHLKQKDLADYLGIAQSVITNWKTRGNNPPAEFLIQICEFLHISIYELLGVPSNNELESIYNKLSPDDKAIVDNIFSRYKEPEQQSSTSMIG